MAYNYFINEIYTKRGEFSKYQADISHEGLKQYRTISDKDYDILEAKIEAQFEKWNEIWTKQQNALMLINSRETNQFEAINRTQEAEAALKEIDNILLHTLAVDDRVNFDSLKRKDGFKEASPALVLERELANEAAPQYPNLLQPLKEPKRTDSVYQQKLNFIEYIIPYFKNKKIGKIDELFKSDYNTWLNNKQKIDRKNNELDDEYTRQVKYWEDRQNKIRQDNAARTKDWEIRKATFYKKQEEYNLKIDQLEQSYTNKETTAIVEHCELVLNNSIYPDSFPKNFDLDYVEASKILIVDYTLPAIENLPSLKEVKFVASKNEMKEYFISESQLLKIYDNVIYSICLRTLHELFEADVINALDAITFNGWVSTINKATGRPQTSCIVSINVKKESFMEIDLSQVDPKSCFKNFKGVGSSKLSSITPIQPIMQIDKSDKRFIDAYDVAHTLDDSTNLAAMDWEDFEHLIREVFGKEFNSGGGEVRVTKASKDGGVDAVAFDPDPIRGGKIVIQAKRYTNTVGVSAVRDLYGTVLNEGATKGILVTTAEYGPDAYEFANGKPLSLLNGSNLLYLLEKHGHKAKIDLKEAKLIAKEQAKQ